MIEIARTQDEEVGDGTTSVIVLGIENILTTPIAIRKRASISMLQAITDYVANCGIVLNCCVYVIV